MRLLAICALGLFLTNCTPMGPPTIARDRFDYVSAISDSWKRQMLLNLLKVRYSDAPVFMDVSSVINSYSLEGEISLGGEFAPVGLRAEHRGAPGVFLDAAVAARAYVHVEPAIRPDAHAAAPMVAALGHAGDHMRVLSGDASGLRVEGHAAHCAGLAHVEEALCHLHPVRTIEP